MKIYKLTDENMQTYRGYQWTLDEWQKTESNEKELCSGGYFHAYLHPLLAVLLNPIHGKFGNQMRLFEAEYRGRLKHDKGLKCGAREMRLTKEIPVPEISTNQRVRFAIYCALEVKQSPAFGKWANNWLENKDRSADAANAAYNAAYAADAAAYNAAYNAAYAADAAANAANAANATYAAAYNAAYAADAAANAANAADAAANAAYAAYNAAAYAADAAYAAYNAAAKWRRRLIALAQKAIKDEPERNPLLTVNGRKRP